MLAVIMREFGPPEVLQPAEVDEVRAGPGEVVIAAEFANVTFVETQIRAGRAPHPSMHPALPVILGNGTGGTVAGQRVVASLNGAGGYAERVAVDARRLIEVPDEVTLRDAVALLADGRTALSLVGRAGLVAGETVLVEAAGGGVGTLLVQLARRAGARVVALAGQPGKLALARDLGADLTVDYRRDDWPDSVRAAVGQVDVVFDGVGGDVGREAFGLLGSRRPVKHQVPLAGFQRRTDLLVHFRPDTDELREFRDVEVRRHHFGGCGVGRRRCFLLRRPLNRGCRQGGLDVRERTVQLGGRGGVVCGNGHGQASAPTAADSGSAPCGDALIRRWSASVASR